MFFKKVTLAALIGTTCSLACAAPISIDFTGFAGDTPISSMDGLTFAVEGGGPGPNGTPATLASNWGGGNGSSYGGLSNSVNGDYPTGPILDVMFNGLASNVSFTFNNIGDSGTFVQALSGSTVIETDSIGTLNVAPFTMSSSGITELQFNNNTGGNSDWIFAVGSLSANVPEPASMLLVGLGMAGLAFSRRRQA
ncbi:MAG: PEP-CTERM sorting domain-containing protein [Burkholderiaceae bacterium]|nr:PEP-CTERM sorting domain-containing protein [Burkholderiaceae bacterium]